jgi:hypothetical protein
MSNTQKQKKTLFSYFSTNKKICLENDEVIIKINSYFALIHTNLNR